jgi:hypothetical protein
MRLAVAGLACVLVSCGRERSGTNTPSPTKAATTSAARPRDVGLDRNAKLALFDELVARIRRHHQFAAPAFANLGRDWDDDVAELRKRMAAGETEAHVLRTLDELQNSLLDLHLPFESAGDPRSVALPIAFAVEPVAGPERFRLYVARVGPELGDRVQPGDILASLDGIDVPTLLREHRFSNAFNQPRAAAEAIASHLVRRRYAYWPELDDEPVAVRVMPRKGGDPLDITLRWAMPDERRDGAASLELACDGVPPRDYGPYELAAVGARVCIYTSRAKSHARYPIVRAHSFFYEDQERLVRLDHHLIRDTLAALPRVDGVLVDLRDNHGGNDPHTFLDWWAPQPYDNISVSLPLDAELARLEGDMLDRILWSSTVAQQYRDRQKRGDSSWEFPFLCSNERCDDGARRTPKHPVTRAPVALLVGPQCISSCDTFALVFASNRFGPLVGAPTAAAYTVVRLPIEAKTNDGRSLGTLQVALSRSRIGEGPWIEGVPLPLDVPLERTFENRETFDRSLVDAGIQALRPRARQPKPISASARAAAPSAAGTPRP